MSISIGTAPAPNPVFTYIQSFSSATADLDMTGLPAYDQYMIVYKPSASATIAAAGITVNGIGGTAYDFRYNGSWSPGPANASGWSAGLVTPGNQVITFLLSGKSAPVGSGTVEISCTGCYSLLFTGQCRVGNATAINRFTIHLTGAQSHKADVYGMNLK